MHDSWYYINVIIFIIRVLKLFLMNYRFVLLILIVMAFLLVPASASLKKIDAKAPVFIGETGIDISSALNGCRQIAWWPAGNTTDTPPGKTVDLGAMEIYNYTISPAVFSGYTGTWYSYDLKPVIPVFEVKEAEFDLKVWDLDHDKDVTGQTVNQSTRITYRIDTNLYSVQDKLKRPDITPVDSFMTVTLTGPNGKQFTNIYTGSYGAPDTQIIRLDTNPIVKSSPYYWKDGGLWDHKARDRDGTVLYPLGTYTFEAAQNLNNMRIFYGNDSRVATGPRTVTFVADPVAATPTVTQTTITGSASPTVTAATSSTTAPVQTTARTPTQKPTWTSAPLPPEIVLLALAITGIAMLYRIRRS
ncbi:MAG: hypothetical protein A4E35_01107 [Methanoregula sp. PtaU1.Bin051]|nr:MAG: hypothetical protein A4E35_01107 [Methanoregula sp. PtaU1.Bin051]